jgi:hypothetical protein
MRCIIGNVPDFNHLLRNKQDIPPDSKWLSSTNNTLSYSLFRNRIHSFDRKELFSPYITQLNTDLKLKLIVYESMKIKVICGIGILRWKPYKKWTTLNHYCQVWILTNQDVATMLLLIFYNTFIYKDIATTLQKKMLRSSFIFVEINIIAEVNHVVVASI